MVASEDASAQLRLEALAAIAKVTPDLDEQTTSFLCRHLQIDQPVRTRSLSLDVLAGAKLTPEQLALIAETLPKVGIIEMRRFLEIFAKSPDEQIGSQLVAA